MLYQNEKDETLVMLTLAGEQRAYEVLVVRYQSRVISAAATVTRNSFMAEDAAQDAFVTAWMKLDTLQEPQKFAAWVCRIAKNCALNMLARYHSFLPLETVDNQNISDEQNQNPAELYALSEEKDELHQSIGRLPEKVGRIIHLHYFEGLSVAEIADRMCVSVGTVKWQLHDGRKRIRRELCAMNEKWNDTLVQKVMKKVEELKLWQLKNSKSGFETIYKDVLRDVEELPESCDKYHALADVLMRGWWWLPGEKNDALFERIKEAAELGKNDEVMEFIVSREEGQVPENGKIEFIRDKQIPRLEAAGFVRALAKAWFWLGYQYFREEREEDGRAAYAKVQEILKPSDCYYALIPYALEMEKRLARELKGKSEKRFVIGANAAECRYIDGALRYWKHESMGEGYLNSVDREICHVFRNASRCDGQFFVNGFSVGDFCVGSDGTVLTYLADGQTVETPCGVFDGCHVWTVKYADDNGVSIYKTYYKEGVGIVRHERKMDGVTDVRLLKSYHVAGGKGLLPLASGNRWEYADLYAPDVILAHMQCEVTHADEEKVIIASFDGAERLKYDESTWLDAIQEIRNEYAKEENGREKLFDVYDAIARAEQLAKTKMEKAHTRAACSVARRILACNPTFNPDHTATGHWNFFAKKNVLRKDGCVSLTRSYRWSFEWKWTGILGNAYYPILFNDVYGILNDATGCIWSDEWRLGAEPVVEYMLWGYKPIKTKIVCEASEPITTKAGTFENCIKLSLDIGGLDGGHSYRGGKKVYYFADGIGIVRTVNDYCNGAKQAVYELSAYEGVGEGYMPFADGMMRRYDAIGLTDGFVGASEYTYVADEEGEIAIFADRTGIRNLPPPITQYAAIDGEVLEERLWSTGKHAEGHFQHAVNNFKTMQYYLAKPGRQHKNAYRSIEICKFNMSMMDLFGGGVVPPAWQGLYAWTALVRAAASFGNKDAEEGYRLLEYALKNFEGYLQHPEGTLLETGNDQVFGGLKTVKGRGLVQFPDGKCEPLDYDYRLDPEAGLLYTCLTARRGWGWFNSVREEERYRDLVARAKKLMEMKKD